MTDNKGFVDLHSHIIPCASDGFPSMEQSMALLETAYEEGIRSIVTTPYLGMRNRIYDWNKVDERFQKLKKAAEGNWQDMRLYQGSELQYGPGAVSLMNDGHIRTLAGTEYILVRFWPGCELDDIITGCRKIMREGYMPIIAHAEIHRKAFRKLSDVELLLDENILIQMNTLSLLSERQKAREMKEKPVWDSEKWLQERIKNYQRDREQVRFCKDMIREGFVTFMGTDCQGKAGRAPVMSLPYKIVTSLTDETYARKIFCENALNMILERE